MFPGLLHLPNERESSPAISLQSFLFSEYIRIIHCSRYRKLGLTKPCCVTILRCFSRWNFTIQCYLRISTDFFSHMNSTIICLKLHLTSRWFSICTFLDLWHRSSHTHVMSHVIWRKKSRKTLTQDPSPTIGVAIFRPCRPLFRSQGVRNKNFKIAWHFLALLSSDVRSNRNLWKIRTVVSWRICRKKQNNW